MSPGEERPRHRADQADRYSRQIHRQGKNRRIQLRQCRAQSKDGGVLVCLIPDDGNPKRGKCGRFFGRNEDIGENPRELFHLYSNQRTASDLYPGLVTPETGRFSPGQNNSRDGQKRAGTS